MSVVLAEVTRGGRAESLHVGDVAAADPEARLVAHAGDPAVRVYVRSAAKPIQALPLVEGGGVERFGLTDEELAVICSSHAGEPQHLAAVSRILQKIGLPEAALQCGGHLPSHRPTAEALIRAGERPRAIHDNCSGKHAGMLAACVLHGWPVETYLDPAHPLQARIAETLREITGAEEIPTATDGCGAPTFSLSLLELATAFARLADPSGLPPVRRAAVERVTAAMLAAPQMVAGAGRLATRLMETGRGRIIAKSGSEGVLGIGLRERPLGVALKIADGSSRAASVIAAAILDQLDRSTDAVRGALQATDARTVTTRDGIPVGEVRAVFVLERP